MFFTDYLVTSTTCQYKKQYLKLGLWHDFTCDIPTKYAHSEFCIFHDINYLKGDNYEKNKEEVDWNIVALFGGGLVLGLGMESSGLATWIGNEISVIMGSELNSYSVFAASAIIGFVMSYSASNTASAVITCPIAATIAIGAGLNPIPPIIAAALGCSIPSAIPSTTPPMAIIYSSRTVRILNMLKTGIVSDLIRLVILILVGPMLTNLIY